MMNNKTYKIKIEFNNQIKMIKEIEDTFTDFQSKLKNKFRIDEDISIKYNDNENDTVNISDDEDLSIFRS